MIQGSEEWFAARLGKVTASRVADMVAKTKTGWGASRDNYAAQLIAERLTGVSQESTYTNAAMQWGTDTEAQARAAYAFYVDAAITEVGFIEHPRIKQAGASPDGLVGDAGLLELKCPLTKTHIEFLRGSIVPGKYYLQMQWQLACTGRKWCDFVSFDPRMPERMRLFVRRLERDDADIADLEEQVQVFLNEIEAAVRELQQKYQ